MSETVSAKKATKRPKRVPLSKRNRLSFENKDPNYMYRVINDQDDRISRAIAGGWEHVESDAKLGDERAAEASKISSHVSKPVGNNTTGYLMRIPKEYYDEDQAEKYKRIDETEKAMTANKDEDQYGTGLTNT